MRARVCASAKSTIMALREGSPISRRPPITNAPTSHAKLWNVLDAFRTRRVGHCSDDFVCTKVDHIRLSGGEMRGDQVVVVRIERQIVESLSAWARQFECGDLLERLAECVCRRQAAEQEKRTNERPRRKQFLLHYFPPM